MWRFNLLHLPARAIRIGLFLALAGLIIQCQVIPDDEIPPELTLSKGPRLGDPVVNTAPLPVTLITVGNREDLLLGGRYGSSARPAIIANYRQFSLAIDTISAQSLLGNEKLPGYTFTWKATGEKIVMVAIFKNVVRVEKNEIANKEDLVWLWTPPKDMVDTGKAKYSDGKKAELNKQNEYTLSPPVQLTEGFYIWCVLTWDRQGYAIRKASRELPLYITK